MNARTVDNCLKIIDYLHEAPPHKRTFNDIVRGTGLSYVVVRRTIKDYYPQCFEEQEGFHPGWAFTGEDVVPGHVSWEPRKFQANSVPRTDRAERTDRSGWTWRKENLDLLDAILKMPLSDIIANSLGNEAGLKALSDAGRTLTRAADQAAKIGKVPF